MLNNMKYKLTKETKEVYGIKVYQIEALKDFNNVSKGDKGGWIEKEENLSQEDNSWVSGDAWVYGNTWVYGDAQVYGNARVYGDAQVYKKIKLIGGYYYHTKQKSEKIEIVDTYDDDYETLACEPKIETENEKKTELLKKADELIEKANELKDEANKS